MVEKTDEELIGTRKWLESIGSTLHTETNPSFNWYSAPARNPEFADAPKMFAFSFKAPTAGQVVAVSTDVPEEFRKYWAIHEFLEEDKPEYAGKCVDTLKEEIALVPSIVMARYVPVRAEFFRGLVEYARSVDAYTPEKVKQFALSRDYMNKLEKDLGGNR